MRCRDGGCKSHGVSGGALRRRAVAMKPQSASYALNLMHALELELAYNEALDVAASFCRSTTCVTLNPWLVFVSSVHWYCCGVLVLLFWSSLPVPAGCKYCQCCEQACCAREAGWRWAAVWQ